MVRKTFNGGVNGSGGVFHTAGRVTTFVRQGAMTPGPSHECDITSFVKLHNKRVTVQWRRAGRRASQYRHPG